jgi:hypothetical protein
MNNSQQTNPTPPPQPPPSPNYVDSRPVRAALCGLIIGIGAVYNREYTKAVVHFAVFAGLVIIAESVGVFGLAAFAFYVFTIIDAYRSAEAIAERGEPNVDEKEGMNFPLWGGILILMGVLFLLDNLGAVSIRRAIEYWPLILIFLGVYLLLDYIRGLSAGNEHRSDRPSKRETDDPV